MRRYNAAILGSGFMGRVHAEALRRLGTVDIVEGGRRALDNPAVDAIHICTPNALHFAAARDALAAGKHVLCEKPLAVSVDEARALVAEAARAGRRNCLNHNLRYYPMVQQIRRLREAGEFGEILVVQGTYSQDWLLYDTDWNWRADPALNGPARAMADIGTHFFDMAEHLSGLRVSAVCADLQTFHKIRKRPKGAVETFAGKLLQPEDYDPFEISTDDFGAVVFRMGGRARGAMTASQVSAGRKNRLSMEIYGSQGSAAWDQERPDELWLGRRNEPNRVLVKDPSLLEPGAKRYADLPGGHGEGYDDTFKQVFRRFYGSFEDPALAAEYPSFADGLRQMTILGSVLESHAARAWVDVPPPESEAGAC